MRRREFIAALGAVAAMPIVARAQERERVRRIGVLMNASPNDSESQARLAAFMQGLESAGWVAGRNARFDTRWSLADGGRVRRDAAELIALHPDVVLAGVGSTIPSLQLASRTVPIVFAQAVDPVGANLIESLAKPGGNATGFTQLEYSLSGKWIELLREIAPHVMRVAVLREPGAAGIGQWAIIQAVAQSLGVELRSIIVNNPGELERAVAAFAREPNGGLVVAVSGASLLHRDFIIALAERHRLPTVYAYRIFVTHGGLLTYGPDIAEQYRRAAGYVDRILKGEKAGELPVQAPTKYELVINMKTAKALGLTVPQALLARADEVIE